MTDDVEEIERPRDGDRSVFVTGAAGFIGRHIVRELRDRGYAVRALSRKVPESERSLNDVEYVRGDVTDDTGSWMARMEGCEAVVHTVGIIQEVPSRGQTFERVHVQGTRNVVAAAVAAGSPQRLVYLSAIGTRPDSLSEYARTKASAEGIIAESGIPYTIFRPSLVVGPGGEFVQTLERLARKPPLAPFPLPFLPIPGDGRNLMQPLWVGDLTEAIANSIERPDTADNTYEIGGATRVRFDELARAVAERIGIRKRMLHMPRPLMFAAASVLQAIIPAPPITTDQLHQLKEDNICDNAAVIADCGIAPIGLDEALDRIYAGGSAA